MKSDHSGKIRKTFGDKIIPDYQVIVENSFDAIFLVKGKKFIYVNPMFTSLSGYTAKELSAGNRVLAEVLTSKSYDLVMREYEARKLGDCSPFQYSICLKTKYEGLKDIELRTLMIGEKQDRLIMGIARDITERKRMEGDIIYLTSFQNLLMKLGKSFINCPSDKTKEAIDAALAEIGEFTRVDRVYIFEYNFNANSCSNTFEWCLEGVEPQIANLQNIPTDSIPHWVNEHKKGKMVVIKQTDELPPDDPVRAILLPQGVKSLITLPMISDDICLGFVGFDSVNRTRIWNSIETGLLKLFSEFLTNLNVKHNYELSLRRESDRAKESDRLKSAFLANLSHEIRTPMNCIVGFSALLKKKHPPREKMEKYIDIINTNADHLLGLINDIIDVSMIESGQVELFEEPVVVEAVFAELLSMFHDTERNVEMRFKAASIPPFIADRLKLKQVLVNLVGNAIKFTDKGFIETEAVLENDRVVFSVKDTGAGIEPKFQKEIFKRFIKGRIAGWKSRSGTGLGLAIVKAYIERMGGEVSLRSRPGSGSTFSFYIPYVPAK